MDSNHRFTTWPYRGLTSNQALRRRNFVMSWLFLGLGALVVFDIGWFVRLLALPLDTMDQIHAGQAVFRAYWRFNLIVIAFAMLPLLVGYLSRPYMPPVQPGEKSA